MFGSWIARWKSRQVLRVPAGDTTDDDECECGYFLLTEDYQPIATEAVSRQYTRPET